MEFSNSTVAGNISTINNLMIDQGGVGNPDDPEIQYEVVDGTLYIVLYHGDLGTGDQILAIQLCQSAKVTPWQRFQFVVFVLGLFHVKMACADAMWCLFIKPKEAHEDETSLLQDVAKLCPQETRIVMSNPGFCCMHQIILHTGISWHLDCWKVEARK